MALWLITIVSMAAMGCKDMVYTFLTIAEARGNAHLSGLLNAAGTPASAIFYSFSSVEMLHGHGVVGWLCLLPVMAVDYIDGRVFTAWGRKIQSDEPTPGAKRVQKTKSAS